MKKVLGILDFDYENTMTRLNSTIKTINLQLNTLENNAFVQAYLKLKKELRKCNHYKKLLNKGNELESKYEKPH